VSRNDKNREIEQLRAISICLVLVSHVVWLSPFIYERVVPLFQYASFGVGVDLFFCISGYVVAMSYCDYFDRYRSRGQFWPAARLFWLRRAYRLLPSAWLWVVIGLICAMYFNRTGVFMDVEQNLKSALAIFSFTANIAHMYGWLAPNNVYWSLSLEEQFYLLLPLFLLLITGRRARIMALLLVIAVQFPLARNPFGDLTAQYLASFRIDGFAWGILIFMFTRSAWYRRLEPRVLLRKPLALTVTFLLFYLLVAVPAETFTWSISVGLLAIITATLVWLASYGNGYLFGYKNLAGPMQWLGARSYGIYLIHLPVIKFTHEAATRYLQASGQAYSLAVVPFLLLFAGVLIVLLAELNFRYVEEPLRRLGTERAKRKLAALEVSDNAENGPFVRSCHDGQSTVS
jgi:peptidoglycan/LPS O-acetylase OafA/YrhL